LELYKLEIMAFVNEKLKLTVHPNKVFIRPVVTGIDFVGYVIRPDYVLVRKRVVGSWRSSMDEADKEMNQKAYHSYSAHAMWANSYGLRQKMSKKAGIKLEPIIR